MPLRRVTLIFTGDTRAGVPVALLFGKTYSAGALLVHLWAIHRLHRTHRKTALLSGWKVASGLNSSLSAPPGSGPRVLSHFLARPRPSWLQDGAVHTMATFVPRALHMPQALSARLTLPHSELAAEGDKQLQVSRRHKSTISNGPFRKLSHAILVTSFGGQCRKKTAIFYECEGFSHKD